MPVIDYKNRRIQVPDSINGVNFIEMSDSQRLSFLNTVEQKNPQVFTSTDDSMPSDEDVGFFEGVGNALGRGANHLTTGIAVAANRAGILSDESTAEQVATDIVDMRQYPMSDSVKSGMQQIQEAEGFGDSALAIVQNPGAVFDVAVQSLVSSVPSLVGMFAGGVAGGAIGNIPGAIAGAASGAGLGSYGVEWSASVVDQMRKEGIDLDDVDQVEAFLADDLKMQKAKEYAEKRAVPIAAFDAITAGVAGRLVSPVRKAVAGKEAVKEATEVGNKAGILAREKFLQQSSALMARGADPKSIAKEAARAETRAAAAAMNKKLGLMPTTAGVGVELGVQAFGGGAGEATAQLTAEGEITSPGEVLLEMFAELPTALVETGIGVGSTQRERSRLKANGLLDEDVINNTYAKLKKANPQAPVGAVYEQSIDFANIYNNNLDPAVIYSDKNNFVIGPSEDIASSLLNSNLDALEEGDTVTVEQNIRKDKKGNPVLDEQGRETQDGTATLTMPAGRMTNLKFENAQQAQRVADIINERLPTSIKEKNQNFNKVSAKWSALNSRKQQNKEARKQAKEENKKGPSTILNDTNMSTLSDEEIDFEIRNQNFNFTPQQYTKAIKSVFKNKKFTEKTIREDLKLEGNVKQTRPVVQQLKKELQNRQIINTSGNLYQKQANINLSERITTSDSLGTGDAAQLKQAIDESMPLQDSPFKPSRSKQTEVDKKKEVDGVNDQSTATSETVDANESGEGADKNNDIIDETSDDSSNQSVDDVDSNINNNKAGQGQSSVNRVKDIADNQKKNYQNKKARLLKQKQELSYSDNFASQFGQDYLPKMYNFLSQLTGVKNKDISIQFVQEIENGASAVLEPNTATGKYVIEISTQVMIEQNLNKKEARQVIARILSEEGFHIIYALQQDNKGPFTNNQIKALKRAVRNLKVPGTENTWYQQAADTYKDSSIQIVEEEAMAALFQSWANGDFNNFSKSHPRVFNLFDNIVEFFTAIAKALGKGSEASNITLDNINQIFSDTFTPSDRNQNDVFVNADFQSFKESVKSGERKILQDKDDQSKKQNDDDIKKSVKDQINKGDSVSPEAINTAEDSIDSGNKDTKLKLSKKAKDANDNRNSFIKDATPNWLLNAQKKAISQGRQQDVGLTVLDLTSKGMWNQAIDKIANRFRRNFVNDLDYLSVIEKETASNMGDLAADISGHTAAQLAKNAASLTAGTLTRYGVVEYTSSGEGGIGITQNVTYTDTIDVLVKDESGNPILDESGNPQYEQQEVEIGGLLDTVLNDVIEGSEQMERNFHHYRLAKRELGLQTARDSEGNLLFENRIWKENSEKNQQFIDGYEQNFPIFRETSQKLDSFLNKLVDFKVNTGLISREDANIYKDSISYIPFYREGVAGADLYHNEKDTFIESEGFIVEKKAGPGEKLRYGGISAPPKLKETDKTKSYHIIAGEGENRTTLNESFSTLREAQVFLEERLKGENSKGRFEIKQAQNYTIEGTTAPVGGMLNNLLINISQTIELGTRNVAAQRIIRDGLRYNTITQTREFVDEDIKEKVKTKKIGVTQAREGANYFVRVNGKKVPFVVHDPLLHESLMSMGMDQSIGNGLLEKTFTVPANVLRELVTRDPGFMLANFLRDSLSAYVTSGRIGTPIVSSVSGIMSAINENPSADQLARAGIKGGIDRSYLKEQGVMKEIDKEMKRLYPDRFEKTTFQKGIGPLKYIWDKLERGTEISDLATRIAVYNEVLGRTGNKAQAIWEAQEVLNFRRRGAYMRFVSAAIPFLNARVQGLDVLYRGFAGRSAAGAELTRSQIKRLAIMRGMYLVGFTSMLWFLQSEDEEFEMINDSERDNNWIILGKYFGQPDTYAKIPIPFEVGLMFKTIPDRILSQAFGTDLPDDLRRSFAQAIFGTLAVGPPTAVGPLIEVYMNYNFLTGRKILSPFEETDIDPRLVASASTSELAQKASELLYAITPKGAELTPKEIDNIIRGYSGTLGSYMVTLFDSLIPTDITKPSRHIEDYPIVSRVLGELKSGGGATGEIYQLLESTRRATNSIKGFETRGDLDRVRQIIRQDHGLLGNKEAINESRKRISNINRQIANLRFAKKVRSITQEEINKERDILEEAKRLELLNIRMIKQSVKGTL